MGKNNADEKAVIPALPYDVLRLILSYLSPGDWRNASRVSKFWHQQAYYGPVMDRVSLNYFQWLLGKFNDAFDAVDSFIDKNELVTLLTDRDIPIPTKIATLIDIKNYILSDPFLIYGGNYNGRLCLGAKYCPLTSKKLKIYKETLSSGPSAYDQLTKFIDSLNETLINVFRLSVQNQADTNGKFLGVYRSFLHENKIPEPYSALFNQLANLLQKTEKKLGNLNRLNESAKNIKPIFLRDIARRGACAWFLRMPNNIKLFYVTVSSGSFAILGLGSYLMHTAAKEDTVRLGVGGGMVGFSGILILCLLVNLYISIRDYLSIREATNTFLESNRSQRLFVNNDVIVEITDKPTERTPLLPENPPQAIIMNNNNASAVSELEMQTDNEKSRSHGPGQ